MARDDLDGPYGVSKFSPPCDPRYGCFGQDHGPHKLLLPWKWETSCVAYRDNVLAETVAVPNQVLVFDGASDRFRAVVWTSGEFDISTSAGDVTLEFVVRKLPDFFGNTTFDRLEFVPLREGVPTDQPGAGLLTNISEQTGWWPNPTPQWVVGGVALQELTKQDACDFNHLGIFPRRWDE